MRLNGVVINTIQDFEVRGRWAMDDFTVQLDGTVYRLVATKVPLRERVVTFILEHPGCPTRDVKGARDETVKEILNELEEHGRIVNEGQDGRDAWHVAEDA